MPSVKNIAQPAVAGMWGRRRLPARLEAQTDALTAATVQPEMGWWG